MKINERTYSSFHHWYPLFKQQTFRSIIVDVPPEVLRYLSEDGIVLPVEAVPDEHPNTDKFSGDCPDDEDSGALNSCEDNDETVIEQPSFPAFSKKLKAAMDALGGHVFIKGNWSAPTDASWIIPNNSLKCSSIEDIYLLLNSSSRLQDNYFNSLKDEDTRYVVIKKWVDIHPSTEFRCFVLNRSLVGISQRDCSAMHTYIPEAKMDIIRDITQFFTNHLKDNCPLTNCTFDVIRLSNGQVILVDFGVFDEKYSKPYLFAWDELIEINNSSQEIDVPEFRYIASTTGVQPTDAFTGFCLPDDLANISNSRQVIDSLVNLIETEMKLQDDK